MENAQILGKSKLVPSVQELAKSCPNQIPQRYIQYHDLYNDHHHCDAHDLQLQIPIIDMEALICGDGVELEKLHSTCQEWGFFQLINHGVSSSLIEKFKLETKELFDLPIEEKKRYWQTPTDVEGFGQAFVVSDEQKLDWADMFFLTMLPKHLRKSHLFPNLPLPYRDTLEKYSTEIKTLATKMLGYMLKALNISDENVFGEGHQSIRMNYYPPCPQPEKAIGLTPHTDETVLITILLQITQVEGLQIFKDNRWVPVMPQPHAFIVNIGDVLELMTNGIYRSVKHRAVVNAEKERISVATFHAPGVDIEVGPIPKLLNNNPPRFTTISMVDYWDIFLKRPLHHDGKKCLDFLTIHPNT
ncbi:unnamed protein product [Amaranthus hypochondriacus]